MGVVGGVQGQHGQVDAYNPLVTKPRLQQGPASWREQTMHKIHHFGFFFQEGNHTLSRKEKSGSLQLRVCAVKVVNIVRAPHVTRGRQTLRLFGIRIVTYRETNLAINPESEIQKSVRSDC